MKTLSSYVQGKWVTGDGAGTVLVNPATEEEMARTSTEGVDFAGTMAHAREVGGETLRAMTFAERGAMLKGMANALRDAREELLTLSQENGGNTRGDAKFDVDGASITLAHYARLGRDLGDTQILIDGDGIQLGNSPRYSGQHIYTPKQGVAVHINAFNFPAWGLAEKAAAALLAGAPVVAKPATATSLLTHRMMELMLAADVIPAGALSLLSGSAGSLLEHVEGQDVLAFTGSGDTANHLRTLQAVVGNSVHVNVEADSLNAAILGPDVEVGSETAHLFAADVVRDMTQKAGQKCTAIRRVLVPRDRLEGICEMLVERLGDITVGNPVDRVNMGPLCTARQLRDIRGGVDQLLTQTAEVFGGDGTVEAAGVPAGKGYFIGPILRRCDAVADAPIIHEAEIFGPVATLIPYDGSAAEAASILRLGAGGLVSSVYSDDRRFLGELVPSIAAYLGRIFLGSAKVIGQAPGPGTVMPMLTHGGPGRAGGGEELGGLRGMLPYMQRTAVQGDQGMLRRIFDGATRVQ